MNRLLPVALLIVLAGCSAKGPRFAGIGPTYDDFARLYILRQSHFYAGGQVQTVFINDKRYGFLRNGGYVT